MWLQIKFSFLKFFLTAFILISFSIVGHTQEELRKNHIRIGVPGFYFFDHGGLYFSGNNLPGLDYIRFFNAKLGIKVGISDFYNRFQVRQFNEVGTRSIQLYEVSLLKRIELKKSISFSPFLGTTFRGGHECVTIEGPNSPFEGYSECPSYGDLGLNTGASLEYYFWEKFSLSAQVSFYRSIIDFNKFGQRNFKPTNYALLGGVFIGWRF